MHKLVAWQRPTLVHRTILRILRVKHRVHQSDYTKDRKATTFLDLPLEMRLKIYEYALPEKIPLHKSQPFSKLLFDVLFKKKYRLPRVMRINKQIREESLIVFLDPRPYVADWELMLLSGALDHPGYRTKFFD